MFIIKIRYFERSLIMKKLISFIVVLSILICTCSFSAFAALDYTDIYYMNGYKIKGSALMVNTVASATTYSEKINYGKAAALKYYYYGSDSRLYSLSRGDENSFVTNGFDAYSVDYYYTSATDEYFGAIGRHKVKATSYMIWSSHGCEDDSHVGSVVPDYSDV